MTPSNLIVVLVHVLWHTFGTLTGSFGFTPLEGLYGVAVFLVLGLIVQYVKARRAQRLWSLDEGGGS